MADVSTHAVLHCLIDDAAIFPPGNAELGQAVLDHERHRGGAYAEIVGPLLVRDVDVVRLPAGRLAIGVIATADGDLERALSHAGVVAVEIPVSGDDLPLAVKQIVTRLAVAPDGVTVSVELPRPGAVTASWIAAADEIGAAGFQVKLRTGGVVASAHPDEDELAALLEPLVARRHRVKLTAGLHRAVRNTQAGTGFEQHGFLNVLVAVHRLLDGGSASAAADVLRDRDGRALADTVLAWSAEESAAVRETFRGFGSCSIAEPYADLVELGVMS